MISCNYIDICICICTCIFRYQLFSPYNIIHMYLSRADCLILDNQFLCFFLGRTFFPALRFYQLLILLCVGLRPCGLLPVCAFSVQFFLLLSCLLVLCFLFSSHLDGHAHDFIGIDSDVTKRHSFTSKSLVHWLFESSCLNSIP